VRLKFKGFPSTSLRASSPVSLRSRVGMTRGLRSGKGKGQSDFSDWPLFMPATTGVYPEPVEGLPHTWRVQYHRPCGA
jgi:hypothetical protein